MKLGFAFIFPWKETWTTTQFNVLFPALEQNDLWKRWNLFATFTVHESLRINETNWAVKTLVEIKVKERKKERKKVKSLSRIQLFATLWTVAYQALRSMGFSRQEHWSGLPFPPPGDLPDPGIIESTLEVEALTSEPPGKQRLI